MTRHHSCSTVRAFAAAIVLIGSVGAASERPRVGSPVPLPSLIDLQGAPRSAREYAGARGLVLLFWAGWSERSIEQLHQFDAAASDLKGRGVGVVAVNVERHDARDADVAALRDRIARLGVHVPVLIDNGLKMFQAYGVVAVPSTAMVDGSGKLTYFAYGYSHGQRVDLFDALDRLAGIERPRPEPPRATAAAIRRLQFGRLQLSQGHVDAARSTFAVAAEADQTFADPLVELAALALDDRDLPQARTLLDRAAVLERANAGVRRESARLAFLESGLAAQDAIRAAAAPGSDPIAIAYLGFTLLAVGDASGAHAAFDRAKTLAGVDPRVFINADAVSDTPARAMTAFRREVAAGRP